MINPPHGRQNFDNIEDLMLHEFELPCLPQVASRIIQLASTPESTASDIEQTIGNDPIIAARALALANSSYYGLPGQISSLHEAVVFLGPKSIMKLAQDACTTEGFLGKGDQVSLNRRYAWRHSLDVAICARTIASNLHPTVRETFSPEQSYAAGLLHDIGKSLMDVSLPETYQSILTCTRGRACRFHEVEYQFVSFNHATLGAALASRWNLPKPLRETIAFHQTPLASQISTKLTACVSLANEVAHYLKDGIHPDDTGGVDSFIERCHDCAIPLRLSRERLIWMASTCRAKLDTAASPFM